MNVKVTAPVKTFFLGLIGMFNVTISRTAHAEYVLPVPMGSPLNYYGVGCMDTNSVAPDATGEPSCTTGGNSNGPSGVPNATAGSTRTGAGAPSQLNSQGFWGAVFTKGGDSRNGDAYSPTDYSGGSGGGPGSNLEYDPAGYPLHGGGPGRRGRRRSTSSTRSTAACRSSARAAPAPVTSGPRTWAAATRRRVTTYYNLWNDMGTPYDLSDDILVYASGTLFERGINDSNASYVDQSGGHGTGAPQYAANGTTIRRCDVSSGVGSEAYPYHLKWWRLPPVLAAGTYRLQITTTNVEPAGGRLERLRRRHPAGGFAAERQRRSGEPLLASR